MGNSGKRNCTDSFKFLVDFILVLLFKVGAIFMKKTVVTIVFGFLMAVGSGFIIPQMSYAYSTDMTSAVHLGWVQNYSRSAINVIDDDGTVYTFIYDCRPRSDLNYWKLQNETDWHDWTFGPGTRSHMETLANCGFQALKELGKL